MSKMNISEWNIVIEDTQQRKIIYAYDDYDYEYSNNYFTIMDRRIGEHGYVAGVYPFYNWTMRLEKK